MQSEVEYHNHVQLSDNRWTDLNSWTKLLFSVGNGHNDLDSCSFTVRSTLVSVSFHSTQDRLRTFTNLYVIMNAISKIYVKIDYLKIM